MKNSSLAIAILFIWLAGTMAVWWFALLPVGENTPLWLVNAQAACFGTTISGLPDAGGWIMITFAPALLITAMLVSMYSETVSGLKQIWSNTVGKTFLLACSLLVLTQCSWAAKRVRSGMALQEAVYSPIENSNLPENYPIGDKDTVPFELVDQEGELVSFPSTNGKVKILTFAFAHCQTVCPALVTTATKALESLPVENTELLIVTLDPWRDTPSALPSLAAEWKLPTNAKILSGEIEQVNKVISDFGIPTTRNEKNGDVVHPAIVYVVSADNKLSYTFNNPPTKWLVAAVTATQSRN